MLLLIDIGNTNTHVGVADGNRIVQQKDFPTTMWAEQRAGEHLRKFVRSRKIEGASFCSVVPRATRFVRKTVRQAFGVEALELTHKTIVNIGIDYPRPASIGPDRLANSVAVHHYYGAPAIVVDFGTAVTFDVVDRKGNYVGGIIAPGLAVMTKYLHEKTALLPTIKIRDVSAAIGKNTEQAMLIGAVHGYRGLIRELISELKAELNTAKLPVVATGGYAKLMSAKIPDIIAVKPELTLEGLRLVWCAHNKREKRGGEKVCYLTDADLEA